MPRDQKTRAEPPIRDEELVALEGFLRDPRRATRAMGVSGIDGYLTALIIGPEVVMPSEYLPWIWDEEEGEGSPDFGDPDEADRCLDILTRMNNRIAGELMRPEPKLLPLFVLDERWSPKEWSQGFADGMGFDEEVWEVLAETHEDWLRTALSGGSLEGRPRPEVARRGLEIAEAIVAIRDYFREGDWREAFEEEGDDPEIPRPYVRPGPKVGRNESCPCGSGRKYKKCCLAA